MIIDYRLINEKNKMDKKLNDCLEICIKQTDCTIGYDTHKICKIYNLDSYNKLNKFFDT